MSWKWFRGSGKHREAAFIQDEGGNYIGKAYGHSGQQIEKNVRLMAAAPDMLQALIDVRQAYQGMFDVMPVAWQTFDHIVESAIAKATGRSVES